MDLIQPRLYEPRLELAQDAQLSIKFRPERTAHDVRGMGFQPMLGHIIRLSDRIMGWKPMPRWSEACLLRTRSFQA
jgi:hypothetical protein